MLAIVIKKMMRWRLSIATIIWRAASEVGEKICACEAHHLGDWRRQERGVAAAKMGDHPLVFSREPYGELNGVFGKVADLKCKAKPTGIAATFSSRPGLWRKRAAAR